MYFYTAIFCWCALPCVLLFHHDRILQNSDTKQISRERSKNPAGVNTTVLLSTLPSPS